MHIDRSERIKETAGSAPSDQLTLGFIPLVDCAPLVVAAELGFAGAEGLSLNLMRETSWANIRDRVMLGHFHAAHMLGPLPIASTLGIGSHLDVAMVASRSGRMILGPDGFFDALLFDPDDVEGYLRQLAAR